jgi:carboxyl-terminal processing protease
LTTARYYTPSGRSIQLSGIEPDIEVEFEATEESEKEKAKFIREKDLKGHMANEDGGEKEAVPGTEGEEIEDRAKRLFEMDNQVRQAVRLLQTWDIFSKMKIGS